MQPLNWAVDPGKLPHWVHGATGLQWKRKHPSALAAPTRMEYSGRRPELIVSMKSAGPHLRQDVYWAHVFQALQVCTFLNFWTAAACLCFNDFVRCKALHQAVRAFIE